MAQQDDYYYEIQLTNKQLVFYFMAGATGLILSFLAGVMVGKGVDSGGGEVLAARPLAEERVVAEEGPGKTAAAPATRELTYAQRLEAEKTDDSLDRGRTPAASPAPAGAVKAGAPVPSGKAAAAKAAAAPKPAPAHPEPATVEATAPPVAPAPGPKAEGKAAPPEPTAGPKAAVAKGPTFTIQVMALKDKARAEGVVSQLKGKGYYAYLVSPEGDGSGLFTVFVGTFSTRGDAEHTVVKLRDQEKFKPFITQKPQP